MVKGISQETERHRLSRYKPGQLKEQMRNGPEANKLCEALLSKLATLNSLN